MWSTFKMYLDNKIYKASVENALKQKYWRFAELLLIYYTG